MVVLLQADLVQRIAEMVDAKLLDGIADVRDESDRTGEQQRGRVVESLKLVAVSTKGTRLSCNHV